MTAKKAAKAKPAKVAVKKAVKKAAPSFASVTVDMHKGCAEFTSGKFRLAVTTQVGPRIIGGFIGKSKNLFRVLPPAVNPGGQTDFKLYGGHRLWHAPEMMPRTYAPDNAPVEIRETPEGTEFSSGIEAATGLEKSILIAPLGNERYRITHRLTNRSLWDVELAPWALSVMAQGGMAVIPHRTAAPLDQLLSDRILVFWPYTDLGDPRLSIGRDYVFVRQDNKAKGPCKIGLNVERGWAAYVNQGTALIKFFEPIEGVEYPDNGCHVESYSCKDFCELETLGPLCLLEPGDTVEHVELWLGLSGLPEIKTEADVKKYIEPHVN